MTLFVHIGKNVGPVENTAEASSKVFLGISLGMWSNIWCEICGKLGC